MTDEHHEPGRLGGTLREVAWTAGHLALYPTGVLPWNLWRHGGAAPAPAPDGPDAPHRRPVILVHGLFDNRSVFALQRRALRRNGFTDIVDVNHNPLAGDVRTKAELLGRRVEEVCERTGADGVHVVGHSLGGLIARYHAQLSDRGARVRTVTTLGTPHDGTLAAVALRVHPLVRQMCPDSAVIAELRAPAPGVTTRFTAFWGDLDPFVIPCTSGALRHADLDAVSIRVPGAGHLSLPAVRGVVEAVCATLTARDTPSAPGRRDCPGVDGGTTVAA